MIVPFFLISPICSMASHLSHAVIHDIVLVLIFFSTMSYLQTRIILIYLNKKSLNKVYVLIKDMLTKQHSKMFRQISKHFSSWDCPICGVIAEDMKTHLKDRHSPHEWDFLHQQSKPIISLDGINRKGFIRCLVGIVCPNCALQTADFNLYEPKRSQKISRICKRCRCIDPHIIASITTIQG